jgi:hypothetical protein
VEGIRMRRSRRIRKSKKRRIQPLCGEYFSWVLYLSFEEEVCESFFCMILDWMWLGEFFLGINVYVTLEINVESMEVSYTLILAMENGRKYIILFLLCYTWGMLDNGGR